MDDRGSLILGDRHKAVYPREHGDQANWSNATTDSPKWRAKKETTRMVFRLGTIQVTLRASDAREGGEAEEEEKKKRRSKKNKKKNKKKKKKKK